MGLSGQWNGWRFSFFPRPYIVNVGLLPQIHTPGMMLLGGGALEVIRSRGWSPHKRDWGPNNRGPTERPSPPPPTMRVHSEAKTRQQASPDTQSTGALSLDCRPPKLRNKCLLLKPPSTLFSV